MAMINRDAVRASADAIDEVKTFLRIDGEEEDSLIAALIAAAVEQSEAFCGEMVLRRSVAVTMTPRGDWQYLGVEPVQAVTGASSLALDGSATALAGSAYELDIGADGRGRIRFLAPVLQTRVLVAVQAGRATAWGAIEEPVRRGIIRLVAHYHANRESADEGGPPPGVFATMRPSRRMRLS